MLEEAGVKRMPRVGDIWKDSHGYFIVTRTQKPTNYQKSQGYDLVIDVLAMDSGVSSPVTLAWEISEASFLGYAEYIA